MVLGVIAEELVGILLRICLTKYLFSYDRYDRILELSVKAAQDAILPSNGAHEERMYHKSLEHMSSDFRKEKIIGHDNKENVASFNPTKGKKGELLSPTKGKKGEPLSPTIGRSIGENSLPLILSTSQYLNICSGSVSSQQLNNTWLLLPGSSLGSEQLNPGPLVSPEQFYDPI